VGVRKGVSMSECMGSQSHRFVCVSGMDSTMPMCLLFLRVCSLTSMRACFSYAEKVAV